MIWEALIGGAVGGLLGGPWGMAAGAALGAGWDVLRGREAPPLDATLTVRPSPDGLVLEAQLVEAVEGGLALVVAYDEEGNLLPAAVARFTAHDQRFQIAAEVHNDIVRCFVPFGVIAARGLQEVTLGLRVYTSPDENELDLQGEEQVRVTWPADPYVAARFWRPMLGLCMAVARADGQVERVEVRAVRERVAAGLKIPAAELEVVTDILRAEPTAPLAALLDELKQRAPWIRPSELLSALADVAHANGDIHAAEGAIIVEVARLLGVDGARWRALSRQLRLETVDPLSHYAQLLGVFLPPTADAVEIAYAEQMAAYAPERLAGLPEEMRVLAWRQTAALARAREALLRAVPQEG